MWFENEGKELSVLITIGLVIGIKLQSEITEIFKHFLVLKHLDVVLFNAMWFRM